MASLYVSWKMIKTKKNISLFVSKKWKLQQKPVRTQTNKFRDNLDIFALVGFKIRNCLPFLDLHVPCFGICPLFIDFLHCREKKLRFSQVVAWIVPSKIFVEQKKYSRLPIWTKSFMLNLCVAALGFLHNNTKGCLIESNDQSV